MIGTASVGVLESTLAADLYEDLPQLFGWLLGAALLSSLGAMYVSKLVWRRIYKLEPEDIAACSRPVTPCCTAWARAWWPVDAEAGWRW